MRRLDRLLGTVLIFTAYAASAAPPDVPAKHWAAASVQSVTDKKIMGTLSDGKFHGSKPVTRYELAVALDRFVRYIEAGRMPLTTSPKATGSKGFTNTSPAVADLLANSFISAESPIAKGTGRELVTAEQLADALGQVTIRLSDRSLPPNKE